MRTQFTDSQNHLQARRRQAASGGARKRHRAIRVAPTAVSCGCDAPKVVCSTDGDGRIVEKCLKCSGETLVERRPGMVVVDQRRLAELTMFAPAT